jgi:hypothetical protein
LADASIGLDGVHQDEAVVTGHCVQKPQAPQAGLGYIYARSVKSLSHGPHDMDTYPVVGQDGIA